MTIYLLSGLGAGEEIFKYLKFPYPTVFIPWIDHVKNESLNDYAMRMTKAIDTSKPFILIGVSFGGIVAQEIATKITPEKVIIISSLKTPQEIPWYVRYSAQLNLFRFLPNEAIRKGRKVAHFFFGAVKKGEKKFLDEIISVINVPYLKWSLQKIGNWEGASSKSPLIHIHGTTDILFPKSNLSNVDYWIEGGHFIVMQKARILSILFSRILK